MNIEDLLKKLQQLDLAYIVAEKEDKEEELDLLEEEFNLLKSTLKANEALVDKLLSYSAEEKSSKLLRKLKIDSIATVIVFNTSPWYIQAAQNDDLWNTPILSSDLHLVVHEYKRLKSLLQEGKTFGVLLEIKDIFELILKLPILLFASKFYNQTSRNINENKVLMQLISKPISLGDWEQIAILILKNEELNTKDPIYIILLTIKELYKKYKLVNWRNNEIGHGALSLETNEKFIKDLVDKIRIMKTFFDSCQSELLSLQVDRENSQLQSNGLVYDLKPYLYFIDEQIYFFDTFYSRSKTAQSLNYIQGHRIYDFDLYKNINYYYLQQTTTEFIKYSQQSINAAGYKATIINVLDKITQIKETVKPTYITEWLKDSLTEHNKGIFLLEAEAGMGKSTFAKMLDVDAMKDIKLTDVYAKAYYANDSYRKSLNNFVQETRNTLSHMNKERLILDFDLSSESITASSFANYLKQIRSVYVDMTGNYDLKLLYIIDGIDEIPQPEKDIQTQKLKPTLLDIIPTAELLSEGVYILLTSRIHAETKKYTKKKIKELTITEQASLERKNPKNITILKGFASKYILKESIKDEKELQSTLTLLYEKADYRLLYLYMIKELLTIGEIEIKDLPSTKDLLEFYLKNLESKYGSKYFQHIVKILLLLATEYEELTTSEISYLFCEENTSFKLLAFLLDLRGLLKSQRDLRGNKFSISHQEIRQKLLEHPQKEQTVNEVFSYVPALLDIHLTSNTPLSDGESYILSHALEFQLPKLDSPMDYSESNMGKLPDYYTIANKLSLDKREHLKYRAISIYKSILEVESSLFQWQTTHDGFIDKRYLYIFAVINYKIAHNYLIVNDISTAYDYMKKALSQLENNATDLSIAQKTYNISQNDIIEVKEFYVHIALKSGEFDSAIEVGNALIETLGKSNDFENISRLYINMAKAYLSKYEMESTFKMYYKAKELTKDPLAKIHIDIEIAKTYRKDGDVTKAKELLSILLNEETQKDSLHEAEAQIQYGLCLFSQKDFEGAHHYYVQADKSLAALGNKEVELYNLLGMSTIYEYLQPPRVNEAKELLQKIIKESKEYGYVNHYVDAMNGLSRKYILLGEFDEAIFYAQKGGQLWEAQNVTGGLLVMYSHIINALTGKYIQAEDRDKEVIKSSATQYIEKAQELSKVVKEHILLEIFETSLSNWKEKKLKVEGML